LLSKRAISFFIRLNRSASDPNELELQNEETNEKLKIQLIDEDDVLISRHPIGANEEWIEEMIPNDEYRNITIS
jgi:hypothetical protein